MDSSGLQWTFCNTLKIKRFYPCGIPRYFLILRQNSIEKLLQTPVCMMSGEELAFLFNNLGVLDRDKKPESSMPSPDRKLAYGIKGIAETFGCSIPTANRIKKSGVINKAISQLGRKIVIDVDMALELAAERKEDLRGNLH